MGRRSASDPGRSGSLGQCPGSQGQDPGRLGQRSASDPGRPGSPGQRPGCSGPHQGSALALFLPDSRAISRPSEKAVRCALGAANSPRAHYLTRGTKAMPAEGSRDQGDPVMATRSRTTKQARVLALVAGVQKHLLNASLTLNSTTFTGAEPVQALQRCRPRAARSRRRRPRGNPPSRRTTTLRPPPSSRSSPRSSAPCTRARSDVLADSASRPPRRGSSIRRPGLGRQSARNTRRAAHPGQDPEEGHQGNHRDDRAGPGRAFFCSTTPERFDRQHAGSISRARVRYSTCSGLCSCPCPKNPGPILRRASRVREPNDRSGGHGHGHGRGYGHGHGIRSSHRRPCR